MANPSHGDRLSETTGFVDSGQTLPSQDGSSIRGVSPLPSASAVRAKCNGSSEGEVSFPGLDIFVKYGPSFVVATDEARALQALRIAFPDGEVLVLDLYGWRSECGIHYIYISLIPGSTLKSVWNTLSMDEIALRHKPNRSSPLRSPRQEPNEEFTGMVPPP